MQSRDVTCALWREDLDRDRADGLDRGASARPPTSDTMNARSFGTRVHITRRHLILDRWLPDVPTTNPDRKEKERHTETQNQMRTSDTGKTPVNKIRTDTTQNTSQSKTNHSHRHQNAFLLEHTWHIRRENAHTFIIKST